MSRTTRKLARRLRKEVRSPRTRYLLLTSGAAFVAERLVRTAMTSGWRRLYGDDPPRNPERLDVSWGQAVTWTAAYGLAIATANLLARRTAAIGWRRYVQRTIPG